MTNEIEAVDQEMLGSIKRRAGVGIAVGVLVVVAGVFQIIWSFRLRPIKNGGGLVAIQWLGYQGSTAAVDEICTLSGRCWRRSW